MLFVIVIGITTGCGETFRGILIMVKISSENFLKIGKFRGEYFWKGWKGQIRVKRPCCQLQDTPQRCKDKLFQKIRAGRQARIQDFSQGGKMLAPLEIFCSIYKKLNLFRANRKKIKALPDCFFYPTLFLTILFCLLRDCRYFLGALARFNSSRRQISRGPGNLLPPPHCVRPCG